MQTPLLAIFSLHHLQDVGCYSPELLQPDFWNAGATRLRPQDGRPGPAGPEGPEGPFVVVRYLIEIRGRGVNYCCASWSAGNRGRW